MSDALHFTAKVPSLYCEKAVSAHCPHTSLPPQHLLIRAGLVAGLNDVFAGRSLTCLLSSLNLANLVFFLHQNRTFGGLDPPKNDSFGGMRVWGKAMPVEAKRKTQI